MSISRIFPCGFVDGESWDHRKPGTYIGYALVWPRESDINSPDRPRFDRYKPVQVYLSNIGAMTCDGWIGWNYTVLCFHPKDVGFVRRPFSESQWGEFLEHIIQEEAP